MTEILRTDPFPHLIIRDVLPWGLYAALDIEWPVLDAFEGNAKSRKYDFRVGQQFDALSSTWNRFITSECGLISARIALLYYSEIQARLQEIGVGGAPVRRNYGRLMTRIGPYRLKPHIDPLPYVATMLLYFPSPGQEKGCGTVLYRTPRGLELGTGSTQYFGESGISCTDAVEIPFTPNTLLAFPNSPISAHGVRIPHGQVRRAYQWHLSTKPGEDL